jgi:uncharacterized membrane protein
MEKGEEKLERIDKEIQQLEKHLLFIEEELKKIDKQTHKEPSKLSLEDLIQELTGAVVVALTVSLSDEIWSLAEKLSLIHTLIIYIFVLFVANLFVAYGNKKGWVRQQLLGFIQLRLLTSAVISFLVAAFIVTLLGIYPNFVGNFNDYLKLVLLVSSFSLIGSLGLDMAK